VVVLLAALHPLALSAQDPLGDFPRSLGDRMSLGLTAGVSIPQGEFSDVAGVGFELVAHVLMVNEARWLGLRVSGTGALYGKVHSPVVGIGRLSTGSRMATVDLGPQIIAPGVVRPYGYATVGLTLALTDPSIDGWAGGGFQQASYTDVAHVLKMGGGLYVPLTRGERSISLDLGAHYRRNGGIRFLTAAGVALAQPSELSLSPTALNPKLLVLSLGVAVGL
jgi:hypothetical protein